MSPRPSRPRPPAEGARRRRRLPGTPAHLPRTVRRSRAVQAKISRPAKPFCMSTDPSNRTRLRALLLCLALAALCAPAAVPARQAGTRAWLWQNPLPQGNAIFAVRFAADKLTGWAVGADGVILHTKDG